MALPVLSTIEECSEFSKTVEPFIPQLYELPSKLLDNIANPAGLVQLYVETNPLISAFAASIVLGAVFLVVAEVNRNYSQVDRFWSIGPNLYIAHIALWAHLAGVPHRRVDVVLAFSTIWSIRLTYNYWRKGGYTRGSEDYRWAILQNGVPRWVFFIFSVTFISFIQSVLLMAFSAAPAYTILVANQIEEGISPFDIAYFAIELGLVLSEWISDGQQWDYQTAKAQYQKDAKLPKGHTQADLDRGFITSGMWAYSRHPNFAAEQTIWFMLYHWSCFSTNVIYNWTFAGSCFLVLLFQGSTWLTELISAGKYPEYFEYQKAVGMFVPTSLRPYKTPPPAQPKVIRTSELAKMQSKKHK